jgi:DNA-binding transcriptional ArsR family regulator
MSNLTMLQVAALAHPARRAALKAIATAPASPEAIARDADISLGVVAYHVRALAKAGLIELDHEDRVRGAVRHVYRLAPVNGLADDVRDVASGLEGLAVALATAGAAS